MLPQHQRRRRTALQRAGHFYRELLFHSISFLSVLPSVTCSLKSGWFNCSSTYQVLEREEVVVKRVERREQRRVERREPGLSTILVH